ncbi:MAG: type VI secretion system tip protein TssI/VgrG, partial [Smithella sp.]
MDIKSRKFRFVSSALKPDTFEVVKFTGSEGLSILYQFEITVVAKDAQLDLEKIIQSRATLTILRDAGNINFHGILISFEQLLSVNDQSYYRAVLTPAFWLLTLTHHNQIFLSKSVPEIIEAALKDGGLTSHDYELRLKQNYPGREYICMYNESHYNFISRWMEREGIYFYFEQASDSEKLIITDSSLTHSTMKEGDQMTFSPVSGLDEPSREEVIKSFVYTQKILPAKVMLKDYNYRKPSLELSAVSQVSEKGFGDVYIYGEHFITPEEGTHLALVRAEELKCRAKLFHGESLIPFLRPGYTFLLDKHFRDDFNVRYLTTDIGHEGSQAFFFSAGLNQSLSEREEKPYYRNSFTAILTDSQFRPERVAQKPRIAGTINAHIDAEGSGEYAELDDQGRYKVRMPFDLNDSRGGKASSWLRMAQPYAGGNHGMHFPLHKGTEVLLTFIDGDPDRPIIAAAVTNPLTPSPVTGDNQTTNVIHSASGNLMEMEDESGSERVRFSSPHMNSFLHMGAPVSSPFGAGSVGAAEWVPPDETHFILSTDGTGKIQTGKGLIVKAGKDGATDTDQNLIIDAKNYMETMTGGINTPATTETFFAIDHKVGENSEISPVDGTVGAPATGDYYLTTKGKYVQNVGSATDKSDFILKVFNNYSEVIEGTKSTHVKSDVFETFEKDATQQFNQKLTQNVKGDYKLNVTKDAWTHVNGNNWNQTTGCKNSIFWGEQFDLNMGAFNAVYLIERSQTHFGLIINLMLALKLDIEFSLCLKLGFSSVNDSEFTLWS